MRWPWKPIRPSEDANDPTSGYSKEDVSSLALKIIWPLPNESRVYGTIKGVEQAEAKTAEMRRQYADYEPKRVRDAIFHWLDFCDRENREARRDIETSKWQRQSDAYREKEDAREQRVSELQERVETWRNR